LRWAYGSKHVSAKVEAYAGGRFSIFTTYNLPYSLKLKPENFIEDAKDILLKRYRKYGGFLFARKNWREDKEYSIGEKTSDPTNAIGVDIYKSGNTSFIESVNLNQTLLFLTTENSQLAKLRIAVITPKPGEIVGDILAKFMVTSQEIGQLLDSYKHGEEQKPNTWRKLVLMPRKLLFNDKIIKLML
jgi:hypothetical protein